MMVQFDKVGKSYSQIIKVEPLKRFVQPFTTLTLLGNVKGELILDMGCGNGSISRLVASKGAQVVGFDISGAQISSAKQLSTEFSGTKYFVSGPKEFSFPKKFDKVFAVMVLCYSKNVAELEDFFNCAFSSLKEKGAFILFDEDKNSLPWGEEHFGRIHHLLPDGSVQLDWVVPNGPLTTVYFQSYTKAQFVECAKKAGFRKISFKKILISPEGKKVIPKEYWKDFAKHNYYFACIFQK